jgi:hypothetical protein
MALVPAVTWNVDNPIRPLHAARAFYCGHLARAPSVSDTGRVAPLLTSSVPPPPAGRTKPYRITSLAITAASKSFDILTVLPPARWQANMAG